MKEIWKDIKDYEGLYQVSNWGRVKSLKRLVKKWNGSRTVSEKILQPLIQSNGYYYVGLVKNNKRINYKIHRLVAEHFIPNPNNYKEVNHKDENKTNNVVTNLEWCDRKYNQNYGTRTEKCSKKVYQYTLDGKFVKEWKSTAECGRNGFKQSSVAACCRGELKTYKGFIWKYK